MSKILIVDDRSANRQFLVTLLGYSGHTLLEADNEAEAFQIARREHPDLIITDILMPVMDGLAAMRHLRADPRFASTPIIALTALAMPGDRERCLQAGATEYMRKPVSLKTLLKTMRKLLNLED